MGPTCTDVLGSATLCPHKVYAPRMITTSTASPLERVAASYVRQSSAKADRTEASPDVQRTANEHNATSRGSRFLRHYEDIGISGWSPDAERKGFELMLADARAGKFNELVVYYVSRFSRQEVMDAIPVVSELHRLGITIISAMEGTFAPKDNMALIYLIMRLDAAHQESQTKSTNIRGVKRAAREAGGWVGGAAPYGLRTVKTVRGKQSLIILEHEADEAENLRTIWATIKQHMGTPITAGSKSHPGSLSRICADMNERGVPTRGQRAGKGRAASQWGVRTLKSQLENPHIAGMSAETLYHEREDGKRGSTAGFRINRDDEGRPVMACEPIIPVEEWYVLQDWLKGRGQGKGLSRGTALLSSLRTADQDTVLRCECMRPMTSMNAGSVKPNAKPVYRCTRANGVPGPGEHEGGNAIMIAHLDDHVARRIFALIQTAEGDLDALLILREATRLFGMALESAETTQERASVVAERADATRALGELYDDLDAGVYGGQVGRQRFLAKKDKIEGRVSAATSRLEDLADPQAVKLPITEWVPDDGSDPIGPGSWWHRASRDDRRTFVALFVERITVHKAATRYGHARRANFTVADRVTLDFVKPAEGEDE